MEKETIVRPSLLSADFLHLSKDVEEAISLGVSCLHFDVMDGSFVEDISFGEKIFAPLQKTYGDRIAFDVHLMVENPLKHVRRFLELGGKDISVHYEALTLGDLPQIQELKREFPQLRLGLAINPETKPEEIVSLLPLFDMVLVMSVVPGKGGQSFLEGSEKKIAALASYRKEHSFSYKIEVDGGINDKTGPLCLLSGADYLVAGSFYFHSLDKKQTLVSLTKEKEVE